MQSTDDSALLRQYAANNSEEAFAALVARYVNLVYSVALRQVGNPHHAEEITQAVFIILAKKAVALRHDKALSSWLFQTTRLTANNFWRSEVRRQQREQEAFMQSILNESGNEVWPDIAPLLDTAVAGLNEKDRRAILLRFYEGRNLHEVGAALGASEDTAKKRVNRAVEKLRGFFTKRGIVLPAAVLTTAISANSVQAAPIALAKTATAVALAKGATVSASTLTLIKGALKIMAWTKAKTAVVIGVGVLLAAGTVAVAVKKIENRPVVLHTADLPANLAWAESIWTSFDDSTRSKLEQAPPALFIRPTKYPYTSGGQWLPDGKGAYINASLPELVGFAYTFRPFANSARIVMPANLPDQGYDLMDTLPAHQSEVAQEELKKQFGLVARREVRETDVLLLQVKDSTRLQRNISRGGQSQTYMTGDGSNEKHIVQNAPLSAPAELLEPFFEKPVIDRTGLLGHYDFNFVWEINQQRWNSSGARKAGIRPALLNELDQYGLELVPSREPVEMLVVEKVK